jgi:predicted SAM-dependent methyltransferase
MKISRYLPVSIKEPLKALRNETRVVFARQKISRLAKSTENIKVVIGSGGTNLDGWISTDKDNLNILVEDDWSRYFNKNSLDALLAEHVWEHLTPEEAVVAAENCFKFLKSGGYLRVAVPDGNHANSDYIADVKPGGSGSGSDDHKVLYNIDTFSKLFSSAGFEVAPLEYFDERGDFHFNDWMPVDGFIHRSKRFDERNTSVPLTYTSLILDAKKI